MESRRIVIAMFTLGLCLATGSPGFAQGTRATLSFQGNPATTPKPPELPPADPTKVVTGIPVVQKKDIAAAPAVEFFAAETSPFTGRYTLRADVGDGIGYSRGFTTFEAMIPLRQGNQSLLFADVRIVNFDQENRWEYNVGGGYRWLSPRLEHVLGVNAFYDSRKTDHHGYHQLGVGFEALGRNLEFRANGYFILGAGHHVIGDTGVVNLGVVNNNFVFQRIQTTEAALGGIELEVGGRIPLMERFAPRGYVAFYNYSAEGLRPATGVRGRLEAQLSERVSAHFAIQNDQVFRTTVSGGLAIHFGAPAYRSGSGRATWDDVLRQRVNRDVNVVISQGTGNTTTTQPVPPPPPPPIERPILDSFSLD